MHKRSTVALAATMIVTVALASPAGAMNLGSLARQNPVSHTDEIVTNSIPRGSFGSEAIAPKFQLIVFTVGKFIAEHARQTIAEARQMDARRFTFAAR